LIVWTLEDLLSRKRPSKEDSIIGDKNISGPVAAIIVVVVVLVAIVGGYWYMNKPKPLGPMAQARMDAMRKPQGQPAVPK
jgi:flagellin-like protein